jgi:glycosyltransferase involved in cell wall biosynthesis
VSQASPNDYARLRIAYLNSQYPALSHTFIEQEVRAIRAQGLHVETFSIRRPGMHAHLGTSHQQAARETFYILDGAFRMIFSTLRALAASPAGFLRTLVGSQRLAPPGSKSRMIHLAYSLEGLRLAIELRRRGLSHVHVHMANNAAAVAMMACRYSPSLRYSLSIHGSAEFFRVDTLRLGRKAVGAMFVRCISDFCRAQVMAWTDWHAWAHFHIVHCGIDATRFLPRPPRRPGPLRLITVGRLDPMKGYHVLLEAIAALGQEGCAVELEMVGEGPERAALEERVRSLGLLGRVSLSGAVSQDEIVEHYDRADAMIVSSFMEGVPVVLMEAMAKELGVVATRVGGIPELVEEGVSGFLVNAGSVKALVVPIRKLAADPDQCRRYGAAGRKRVLAEYSTEKLGIGMAGLFLDYLGKGGTTYERE